MRNGFRLIAVVLLILGPLTARGQRMDRGIDLTSQPCFVKKGTWMIGGGASYMLHNNNDSRLLIPRALEGS